MGFPTPGQTIYGGWTQQGESHADLDTRFATRNSKVEGVVGDSVTPDRASFNTLVNVTMQPGGGVVDLVGVPRIEANMTIPANIRINYINGSYLAPDGGVTVTHDGTFNSILEKKFGGGGTVSLATNKRVKKVFPQWWGGFGDGVADPTAAIQSALSQSDGKILDFGGSGTFATTAAITPPGNITIDLTGATLKPTGNVQLFNKAIVAAVATTGVTAGATLGSRSITVASAAGLVIGHRFRLTADNTGPEDAGSYPSVWGKIVNIVGTTVTLDKVLPCTFNGTVTISTYAALYESFSIRGGVIDGAANTYNAVTGQAFRLQGYETVRIERMRFPNWANAGTLTCPVQIMLCVDAWVDRLRFTDCISQFNMLDIQDCDFAEADSCSIDSDSFGMNLTRCGAAHAINNKLQGRRKRNADDAVAPVRSVRGIKCTGNATSIVTGNTASDYESPFKVDALDRFTVNGNHARNAGLSAYAGQNAINCGSITPFSRLGESSICNNTVENCGGNGIAFVGDTKGRVIISGNIVRKCFAHGIYSDAPHLIVTNNQIIDFATEGTTTYSAIALGHATGRHIVDNNGFHNDVTATPWCMQIASPNAMIGKHTVSTANKLTSLFGVGPFSGDVGAAVYLGVTVANVTGDGTLYTMLYDSEFHDNGDCYDVVTGKFKALLPGLYTMSLNNYSNGIGGAHTLAKIEITHFNAGGGPLGVRDYQINPQGILAGGQTSLPLAGSFKMAAGDYLQIRVAYSNGTKVVGVVGQAGATNPQFTHANFTRVAA
jgi:hypothetical protein